ncbi:MAG: AraC family transcriptional regulator [Ruminococcaceae bacterium]|nr:AraC family transcriptional regulator [Oscillospiraceae bacterium]
MVINYDVENISKALQDFRNATGVDMELLKTDFSPACNYRMNNICYCRAVQSTQTGKKACRLSDAQLLEKCRDSKKTQTCICHAGLINVAIPLLYENVIIGYIIFGRMKPDENFMPDMEYMKKIGLDIEEMREHYAEIIPFDSDKIHSVSNIAIMLAKYILLKNMLKPNFSKNLQRVVDYISNNLDGDLSIKDIAENVNISKSVLYKNFHAHFNCTVSEYINIKRVEKSIELMTKNDISIEEISQKSGFSSAAYYSRIFKKHMGLTPMKYKRTLR